jgi:DNA mismatch endonuclease, patch repair protein
MSDAGERPPRAVPKGRPIPQSAERSRLLGRVKQSRTRPEEIVAAILRRIGLSYRRNVRGLPGTPDFANRSRRFAIFVNGCFWHRHTGCRRATLPKNNRAFWLAKFTANRQRDAESIRALRRMGFRVLVIWECRAEVAEERLARVAARLRQG